MAGRQYLFLPPAGGFMLIGPALTLGSRDQPRFERGERPRSSGRYWCGGQMPGRS
jgi:hypothetical protein